MLREEKYNRVLIQLERIARREKQCLTFFLRYYEQRMKTVLTKQSYSLAANGVVRPSTERAVRDFTAQHGIRPPMPMDPSYRINGDPHH